MSDKWETVQAPKRKPKPPPQQQQNQQSNGQAGGGTGGPTKSAKPKKYSAKTPASFPLNEVETTESVFDGLSQDDKSSQYAKKKVDPPKSQKKQSSSNKENAAKPIKRRDLQSTLNQFSGKELLSFFEELRNAGSVQDVCLSWIKYSADALNTKLSQVIPPEASQWPNDLNYPKLPSELEDVVHTIITQTSQARKDVGDILGVSFASLLASIPTLIQRGDAGWGYLLFLREMCRLDPSLPIRKMKSFVELMESYGNKKEIGICVLWACAQAGINSPHVLKIASQYLLPYYGFKHYKLFVLAALETISSSANANMALQNIIDPQEFDEFFKAAFDPKRKRDLEKIYPRVREIVLKGLNGQGSIVFLNFLQKVGEKEFAPLSAYGKEVFEVLLGCLENDSTCIETWRDSLTKYPKESIALLSYLSKVPESVKCSKILESKLIQSDEFAVASVKNPELLRYAKKLQTGLERVAASKKRIFSWKMAIFSILVIIGGLLYLDVWENGKGNFSKSNTGKLLQKYGLLEQTLSLITTLSGFLKIAKEYSARLFRGFYEGVRPVLQSLTDKVQAYIPQLTEYMTIIGSFLVESLSSLIKFMQEKVFIGVLSPENLRKVTKESLSFIWSNILYSVEKMYEVIEKYINAK